MNAIRWLWGTDWSTLERTYEATGPCNSSSGWGMGLLDLPKNVAPVVLLMEDGSREVTEMMVWAGARMEELRVLGAEVIMIVTPRMAEVEAEPLGHQLSGSRMRLADGREEDGYIEHPAGIDRCRALGWPLSQDDLGESLKKQSGAQSAGRPEVGLYLAGIGVAGGERWPT